MTKDAPSSKKYEAALKAVLEDFFSKDFYSREDVQRYIEAFSFYLSAGDDAYRYHTAFLVQKDLNFQRFLRRAGEKQRRLYEFVERLKQSEDISRWIASHPAQAERVSFSIDDFFRCGLTGDGSFCEEVSLRGVEQGKNIVTICFSGWTASFFYSALDRDMKEITKSFLSMVAGKSGEGKENGPEKAPV